jgi:hypothetical protein
MVHSGKETQIAHKVGTTFVVVQSNWRDRWIFLIEVS